MTAEYDDDTLNAPIKLTDSHIITQIAVDVSTVATGSAVGRQQNDIEGVVRGRGMFENKSRSI